MKKNLILALTEIIRSTLKELNLPQEISKDIILDLPSDSRFGDLSTNIALRLSKALKKSPFDIANEIIPLLKDKIQDSRLSGFVKEVKAEGAGFINFYYSEKYYFEELRDILKRKERYFRVDLGKKRKVLLEFVSANPTGALSVAHARQAVVGDCLANVLSFSGYKVKKEYYLNDEGNQINILGESVRLRQRELSGEKIEFPENHYQGEYIYEIAKKTADRRLQITEYADFAANYILDIIKKELDDFGVRFDYWYSQKSLRQKGKIKQGLDFLKKKGFLYEQDGALWFKSTQFGDDKDRVVVKSDGSYTYLAPDIAYHREKFRRGFSWLINLWGPDHHGYINRLKAAVQALGYGPESLTVVIVQLATIFRDGLPVQMSTRRGEYITLREVLNEVGKDASRFFFLMRRTSAHLDFDLALAKKQSAENPVYYVQYAHARIASILRAGPVKGEKNIDLSVLKEKEEILLIKKILQFSQIQNICCVTQDPYMLTVYLQELSVAFHKFYDLHRVLGQEESLTQARIGLIEAAKTALALGLKLMGISRPEQM